jgi:hypothetical protein
MQSESRALEPLGVGQDFNAEGHLESLGKIYFPQEGWPQSQAISVSFDPASLQN